MPRKSPASIKARETSQPILTSLVDEIVDAPEGIEPAQWRVVLNRKTTDEAKQYEGALMQLRGIPFNRASIPVTDIVAIRFMEYYDHTPEPSRRAQLAISQAIATYERWAEEAKNDAWLLALLSNNKFKTDQEPLPYEWEESPPGILYLEAPRNLEHDAERRLKLIIDQLDIGGQSFNDRIMDAVNGAIAKAIQFVQRDAPDFNLQQLVNLYIQKMSPYVRMDVMDPVTGLYTKREVSIYEWYDIFDRNILSINSEAGRKYKEELFGPAPLSTVPEEFADYNFLRSLGMTEDIYNSLELHTQAKLRAHYILNSLRLFVSE